MVLRVIPLPCVTGLEHSQRGITDEYLPVVCHCLQKLVHCCQLMVFIAREFVYCGTFVDCLLNAVRIFTGCKQNDFGYAVTCLAFLPRRVKMQEHVATANLVSCGGNGWVRFWNTASSRLVGEFVAHIHGMYLLTWAFTSHEYYTALTHLAIYIFSCIYYMIKLCSRLPLKTLKL